MISSSSGSKFNDPLALRRTTSRMKKTSRLVASVVTELEPTQSATVESLLANNKSKKESLPGIAGVALGIQHVRLSTSLLVNKATKKFPGNQRPEMTRTAVMSKAIQVSGDEEGTSLSNIRALEKENLFLKALIEKKDTTLYNLKRALHDKETQYNKDIEEEVNSHERTRNKLEEVQNLVEERDRLLNESIMRYEKMIQELKDQYEEAVASLHEQTQLQISIRDEKIKKLKHQISELFKEKSWEHQQQMEERQRELDRLTEQNRLLQTQLRKETASKKECEQCKSLISALEDKNVQLKLKARTIDELQSMCQRFQKQLREQEKLQRLLVTKSSRIK
ncbi:golgin subfamily A member 6-like protein 22 [Spea bombifrons]|uniref:golgin subfamily A member 6-like protein 22 n=1 Tax=Spea bombifrons TaxID=233779 RepID=UPI00234BC8C5|nr:golgin subfamily A member 6-like protein 22 [Spea bombifrons]